MKRYHVLRNNREFGPFLLHELKPFGLYTTDLIWVDEESTSWRHPTEIDELNMLAKAPEKAPAIQRQKTATPTPVAEDFRGNLQAAARETSPPVETDAVLNDYFSYTKETYQWRPSPRKLSLQSISASLFGLGILLVGVMMGAFVVKKLVEHFEFEPAASTADAVEIKSELMPVSTGSYAAKSILPLTGARGNQMVEIPRDSVVIQTKTTKENAPVTPVHSEASTALEQTPVVNTASAPANNETAPAEEPKEEPKKETTAVAETPKKAPSLSISANAFKVGMFGGISDLELSISNPSSIPVNKATVEVDFLKPNGSVIKTQTLSVENISPGATKKLMVPSSSRGVNVRYRVTGVDV